MSQQVKRGIGVVVAVVYFALLIFLIKDVVPGWGKPVLAIAGPIALFVAVFLSMDKLPRTRVMPHLRPVIDDWYARHPEVSREWTEVQVPKNGGRFGAPGQVSAWLGRFSGNPVYSWNPTEVSSHEVLKVMRTRIGDFQVMSMCVDEFGVNAAGVRVTNAYIQTVSIDTPAQRPRLAIYRLHGPRTWPGYQQLARWRFRTGDRRFDRRFFVEAADRDFARVVLNPQVIEWINSEPIAQHLGFIFEHGTLNTWLNDKFHVTAMNPMADQLIQVFQRIPAQVWRPDWQRLVAGQPTTRVR